MEYISLKDVCKINMGQSPDSSSYNDTEDGIPFFQGNADFGEKYPITRVWCNAPTKIAEPEDILISVRAPIGALNYAKEKCCIGRGLAALTPDKNKVSPEFVYWFLKGKNAELNSKGTGSTFKAISRKVLEETRVPDISLERQCEYAKILEKVYGVIQKRKEEIRCLDDLIKARFVELFGNPAVNEKNWEIKDLESVTTIVTYGLTVRPEYIDKGIDLVSAREIHKGYVAYDEAPKISEEDFAKLSEKGKPQKFDILFSKTGSIGHCALVEDDRIFAITQNAARVGLKLDLINPIWLLYYLRMDFIQDWCKGHAKGNAVKDFQLQDMKIIPLFDCPMELQKQFATFVHQVDKSKVAVQRALAEAQTLFDSLMQKYFS